MSLSIAKFKAHDSKFWKMWVRSDELSNFTIFGDSFIYGVVVTIMILMEDVSVSMRKGSSFDILTRKSDMETVLDKSWKSQSFSCSPVDTFSCIDCFVSLIKDFSYESMEIHIFWKSRYSSTHIL